ncbi:hypothetical protein [Lacipirellula sp.]|uniref:hypothetical protein n=1 Tax=Lacipirellula sp. TaxID=2691419 RepID=UPI003D09A396
MLMKFVDVQRLIGVTRNTLVAMQRDGRLPQPVDGVAPLRWDAATIRNAILAGTLATRPAGRPKGAKGRKAVDA